jgi:hypothetical protein
MLRKLLFLLIVPFYINSSCAEIDSLLQRAQASGRTLCIALLGPKPCPWSEKFQSEILDQGEVAAFLNERFFFVQGSASDMGEIYPAEELPALLLAYSPELIIQIPYQPLQASDYLSYVKEAAYFCALLIGEDLQKKPPEELQELYVEAHRLRLEALKEKILQEGLKTDKGTFFLLQHYAALLKSRNYKASEVKELRQKILSRDKKNSDKSHLYLAFLDFEARKKKFERKRRKSSLVIKPLVDYIKQWGEKDTEGVESIKQIISNYVTNNEK